MALPVNDLTTEAIFERNTKSVCYENNLYTQPGSTAEEKMLIEKFYSDAFESKYEQVYEMLTDQKKTVLNTTERELIIGTVATMFYRVPIWQKKHTDVIKRVFEMCIQLTEHTDQKETNIENETYVIKGKTAEQLVEEYVAKNKSKQVITQLNIAMQLIEVRLQSDNVYIFKLEDGDSEFITSDNPVILQNPSVRRIIPFDPTNIMKLPLDSKHYLMLMPNKDKSDLNRVVRRNAKGGFSKREELISNTEQMERADQYLLGSISSLNRFLNTKDIDIPLTVNEQKELDKVIVLGRNLGLI